MHCYVEARYVTYIVLNGVVTDVSVIVVVNGAFVETEVSRTVVVEAAEIAPMQSQTDETAFETNRSAVTTEQTLSTSAVLDGFADVDHFFDAGAGVGRSFFFSSPSLFLSTGGTKTWTPPVVKHVSVVVVIVVGTITVIACAWI